MQAHIWRRYVDSVGCLVWVEVDVGGAGVFQHGGASGFGFRVLGFGFGLWTRRGVIGELLQELLCFDYGLLVYIDLRLAEPCRVGEPGAVGGDVFLYFFRCEYI